MEFESGGILIYCRFLQCNPRELPVEMIHRLPILVLACWLCLSTVVWGSNTPPDTPSSVTLTRADGTVTASDYAVTGATKYHITYSSDGKYSWSLASKNHTNTSITINGVDNSKAYVVAVRAGNDHGWSSWRNSSSIASLTPPTPTAVTVSRANKTLTASGYTVSNATKYHITYSPNGGQSWRLASKNHTETSITISGVDNGKTYIVGVRAGNTYGWSGWRNSAASGPPEIAPDRVAIVVASRGDGTLTGMWLPVSNATKYDVNYRTEGGSWQRGATGHTQTRWTLSGADNNATYRISVRAVNDYGESAWRDSALSYPNSPPIMTDPLPDPIPQVTLTASNVTHSGATLTIGGEHTGAWWYERFSPAGDDSCNSVAANAAATLSGLTSDTYHRYGAYNKSGCNGVDIVASGGFTTAKTPLATVAGLTAAAPNTDADTSVQLTWTAPSSTTNIANFQIQRCASSACSSPVSGGTPASSATEHTVTGLTRNTAYHFRIRAVTTSNSDYSDSAWSATVSRTTAKTPLPAVTGFSSSPAIGVGNVTLSWTAITHSALWVYRIQHCGDSDCSDHIKWIEIVEPSTTYTETCGTGNTCYYRIQARATTNSSYTDGPWTDVLSVTG